MNELLPSAGTPGGEFEEFPSSLRFTLLVVQFEQLNNDNVEEVTEFAGMPVKLKFKSARELKKNQLLFRA